MVFSKVATPRQIDLALLALRVSTGLTMAAHGYQKVFTYGIAGITSGFTGTGIPLASRRHRLYPSSSSSAEF